jgi:hypothetical protein
MQSIFTHPKTSINYYQLIRDSLEVAYFFQLLPILDDKVIIGYAV